MIKVVIINFGTSLSEFFFYLFNIQKLLFVFVFRNKTKYKCTYGVRMAGTPCCNVYNITDQRIRSKLRMKLQDI